MPESKLRVGCIQLKAHSLDDAEEGLKHALEMVDEACKANPDIIVLPECTYPSYFLAGEASAEPRLRTTEEILEIFAKKAREHKCYIALGLAEEVDGKIRYNSAFLLNPAGDCIHRVRKQMMWHCDEIWFKPGQPSQPFSLPWGAAGMVICADARVPEIPRGLAVDGARLLLDTTCLVSSGKDPSALTNAQVGYMLRTRAVENQMWVLASNKVGMEADSVVYCGRSVILSPAGEIVAQAGSEFPEIIVADIPLPIGGPEAVDGALNPIEGRRPETYCLLTEPYNNLPVVSVINEAMVPKDNLPVVGALQIDLSLPLDTLLQQLKTMLHYASLQEVDVVVLPEPAAGQWTPEESDKILGHLKEISGNLRLTVIFSGVEPGSPRPYKTAFAVSNGRLIHKYRKAHLELSEKALYSPGDGDYSIVRIGNTNFGIVMGYEGLIPEVTRILTLQGADVVLWPCHFKNERHEYVARTRSAENRVFTVASNAVGASGCGGSLVAGPQGAILAQAFAGKRQLISALIVVAEARCKKIMPNTDAVYGRRPSGYGPLVSCKRNNG